MWSPTNSECDHDHCIEAEMRTQRMGFKAPGGISGLPAPSSLYLAKALEKTEQGDDGHAHPQMRKGEKTGCRGPDRPQMKTEHIEFGDDDDAKKMQIPRKPTFRPFS